jgi:hypothetical protein
LYKLLSYFRDALLVYQDDSSDELTDKLDDMLLPGSDTDNDDWNEAGGEDSSDAEDDVVDVDDDDDDEAEDEEDGEPMANGVGDSSEENMDDD